MTKDLVGFLLWACMVAFLLLVILTTGAVEDGYDE